MKRIFCFIKQDEEKIDIAMYLLDVKEPPILTKILQQKQKKNYEIIQEIILSFPFNKTSYKESLKTYGSIISDRLKEKMYEDAPVDVVFDLEGTFSSQFALPKLNGKALNQAYENELERQFGSLLDDYLVYSKKSLNESKGYTYALLAVKQENYKKMLDILNNAKLKVDKCVYLPSIFTNITSEDNEKNIGIFMDDKKTYLFISQKEKITSYLVTPFGYESINEDIMEKFNVKKSDVNRYRTENISKIALKRVIYHTMRKIIEQVYCVLLADSSQNKDDYQQTINKTYIYSLDGRTDELLLGFPPLIRKRFYVYQLATTYRYQVFIEAFYDHQKGFIILPNRMKYEKK